MFEEFLINHYLQLLGSVISTELSQVQDNNYGALNEDFILFVQWNINQDWTLNHLIVTKLVYEQIGLL